MSEEEALSRIKSQIPIDEKEKLADFVIDNRGDLDKSRQQAIEIFKRILNDAER